MALFDGESLFFADVLERNGELVRSGERPSAGLYPLMAEQFASLPEAARAIRRWLTNRDEFWLERGFPATARSDRTFRAEAEWKDKRLNCPWNGRSWPMANSHLVDAAAAVARRHPELRSQAGEALVKAIRLLFHEQDPRRPNSYEHYNPVTGTPALYRGYDDYMHSWVVDLILRHAVGVVPGGSEIDPLPLGIEWIECKDIPHPDGRLHVRIEADRVVRLELERWMDPAR